MNKHLKQVLCMSLSALVIAGTGTFMSVNYHAHASRHNKVIRVYHHKNHLKNIRFINQRTRVSHKRIVKKLNLKRYNHKAKRMNHKRNRKHSQKTKIRVYRSRFKRSDNKRALKRSGYFDARNIGGNFIFNKYAPNDKRAVVPKKFDGTNWYQGKFGQKNPVGYYYDTQYHDWLRLR